MPNDKKNCVMVAYSETGNNAVLIVGRKTKFINADINESNRFNYKYSSAR